MRVRTATSIGAAGLVVCANEEGIATLDRMSGSSVYTYYAVGPFTVTASYGAAKATFSLTAMNPVEEPISPPIEGATLEIQNGDEQTLPRSGDRIAQAKFAPLSVLLLGPDREPIADARIHFTCVGPQCMACQVEPSGAGDGRVVRTGKDGIATLDRMSGYSVFAYHAAGSIAVTASYGDTTVIFTLVVSE